MSEESRQRQLELYARWRKSGGSRQAGRSRHDVAVARPSWEDSLSEPWHFEYQPEQEAKR